jgi:hypothetical protein
MLEERATSGERRMADLIYVTTSDGIGRVINLDHVVQIRDMPQNLCEMTLADGTILVIPASASQIANLHRLGKDQRTI